MPTVKPMTSEEFARNFPALYSDDAPLEVGYRISAASVSRIALSLRQREEAMEALKPFAAQAEAYKEFGDDAVLRHATICVYDIRRAAALLKEGQG